GLPKDLLNGAVGKVSSDLGVRAEASAAALFNELKNTLSDSSAPPIHIIAHSQGAIIVHNALVLLRSSPKWRDLTESAWLDLTSNRIQVTTFGAAQHQFNIQGVHAYDFSSDFVVNLTNYAEKSILTPYPNQSNVIEVAGNTHSFNSY